MELVSEMCFCGFFACVCFLLFCHFDFVAHYVSLPCVSLVRLFWGRSWGIVGLSVQKVPSIENCVKEMTSKRNEFPEVELNFYCGRIPHTCWPWPKRLKFS